MPKYQIFIQQLINGLTIGTIYALIALGYTMVYGIIKLINFAHGEVFMVGAFVGYAILMALGMMTGTAPGFLPAALLLVFVGAMSACGLLGVTVERSAYRPLRGAPRLAGLITAIGVSILLQNVVMLIFGPQPEHFPNLIPGGRIRFGQASITGMQIFIVATSVALMLGLHWFIKFTRLGTALRATSQDARAAGLMGISVDRTIALCFFIGSVLAGAGGVIYGMYYTRINFYDGYLAGLKAFTAAVLGGIGSIPGAMFGGLTIGLVEALGAGYISSEWKDGFAFMILVLLLLFRPSGLAGRHRFRGR